MASINDVAKLAGVSITTVSKVINNYPDVSPKTRRKIMNIINEVKFQPNVIARGLVKGRSWAVGIFLISEFNNPFVSGVLSGMKRTLENSGYDLIYLSQGRRDPNYNFVNHCLSRNVDGVVVFGLTRSDRNLHELIEADIPTVFIDIDLYGNRAGFITSDNINGMQLAVDHLLRLGHTQIGYLSPQIGNYITQIRLNGFTQAIQQISLQTDEKHIMMADDMSFSQESGLKLMLQLLALPEPPTAVVCASDAMAVGALRAAESRGLTVPKDIAVVGFDDSILCDLTSPKLTSVRQDIEVIGEKALEMLIAMIEDPTYSPNETIMPTELVIRESCGASGLNILTVSQG